VGLHQTKKLLHRKKKSTRWIGAKDRKMKQEGRRAVGMSEIKMGGFHLSLNKV